ncbi:MAG: MarR family transcriptional regulator [Acidobacteria bacterium]|nr:MarR family transcriptional regulator [Acidobacteriota bacterium]
MRAHARDSARELLEIVPLVMRTVAAELRAAGELPAPAHFGVLMAIGERSRTLSELALLRGVSLPSMSNSVAALAQHGWVRRAAHARDRRTVLVEMTGAGRAVLERVGRAAQARLSEALAPLDPKARRELTAGLAVLRRVFAAPPAAAGARLPTRKLEDRRTTVQRGRAAAGRLGRAS